MRTRTPFPVAAFAAFAALSGCLALMTSAPVDAQEEQIQLTKLYKDVAEANNYPVVEGLLSARAEVTSTIMDQVTAAFQEAAGAPIKVSFTWSRPDENSWPEKKFEITGIPAGLTDLEKRAQLIFSDPKDFVIEDPVYLTFAFTEAGTTENGGHIMVKGTGDQISSLTVDIDGATHKVEKMVMQVGGAEYSFDMTREKIGDKWVIKKLVLVNPQATRHITYEYAEVDGFLLPSKMTVEYPGTEEPAFDYTFRNWEVTTADTEEVEGLGYYFFGRGSPSRRSFDCPDTGRAEWFSVVRVGGLSWLGRLRRRNRRELHVDGSVAAALFVGFLDREAAGEPAEGEDQLHDQISHGQGPQDAERHEQTGGGGGFDYSHRASWAIFPPTIVITTSVFRIRAGSIVMMSSDSTVRSASLPVSIDPSRSSSNAAQAASSVKHRRASSRVRRWSGDHPPGG